MSSGSSLLIGPPMMMTPRSTSWSAKAACSSQNGCPRGPCDQSQFTPLAVVTANTAMITPNPFATTRR
jgi:hypothetical protein